MRITKFDYNENLDGYYIDGVAVKANGAIGFFVKGFRGDSNFIPGESCLMKRLVFFYRDENGDEKWGHVGWQYGKRAQFLCAIKHPLEQFIVAQNYGSTYTIGGGEADYDSSTNGDFINCVKSIGGYAYTAGLYRRVVKRNDLNDWQDLNNGITTPNLDDGNYTGGFDFIDGFSETEIYAGGGQGDLWQFNGEKWHQISFPSDMFLKSICCADDGFVYIGAENGTVFKGRNDEWKLIHQGNLILPFRQMVWYEDRIWATSNHGVWQIVDDKVIEADLPREVMKYSGYIDCNDKTLVLAGVNGAARLENGEWDILIDCQKADIKPDNIDKMRI